MIKANQKEQAPAGSMAINLDGIRYLRSSLQFPIDVKARDERIKYDAVMENIRYLEGRRTTYLRDMEGLIKSISEENERLAAIGEPAKKAEPSLEVAKAQLDALAKLPWVQEVSSDGGLLRVKTQPGMLKTLLDRRIVDFGGGVYRNEYLAEPVMVPMPQYEINFNPGNAGKGNWASNANSLGIRLINTEDTSKYIGGKVFARQTAYPHWASNGSHGHDNWNSLCLGEYAADLNTASIKSLTAFFEVLATYLQTSGDEHAYRSKADWALTLGKPEYNEHTLRTAIAGETTEMVEERYRRDFRLMNKLEIPAGAVVNPGSASGGGIPNAAANAAAGTAMYDAVMRARGLFSGIDVDAAMSADAVTQMLRNTNSYQFIDEAYAIECTEVDCGIEDCACDCHEDEINGALMHST